MHISPVFTGKTVKTSYLFPPPPSLLTHWPFTQQRLQPLEAPPFHLQLLGGLTAHSGELCRSMKLPCLPKKRDRSLPGEVLQTAMEMNARTWTFGRREALLTNTVWDPAEFSFNNAGVHSFPPYSSAISSISVSAFICIPVFEDFCRGSLWLLMELCN